MSNEKLHNIAVNIEIEMKALGIWSVTRDNELAEMAEAGKMQNAIAALKRRRRDPS